MSEMPEEFKPKPGASIDAINDAEAHLHWLLPDDYRGFLRLHNGGEGFWGDNYLILWSVEELGEFNFEYQVDEYAQGLILFGSDGGGEAFAFDNRVTPPPVVKVPFIGMDLTHVKPVANSFEQFLSSLKGI